MSPFGALFSDNNNNNNNDNNNNKINNKNSVTEFSSDLAYRVLMFRSNCLPLERILMKCKALFSEKKKKKKKKKNNNNNNKQRK